MIWRGGGAVGLPPGKDHHDERGRGCRAVPGHGSAGGASFGWDRCSTGRWTPDRPVISVTRKATQLGADRAIPATRALRRPVLTEVGAVPVRVHGTQAAASSHSGDPWDAASRAGVTGSVELCDVARPDRSSDQHRTAIRSHRDHRGGPKGDLGLRRGPGALTLPVDVLAWAAPRAVCRRRA